MLNLDKTVELYLQMNTNYALMLTGDWGTGKSYYFMNVLKGKISSTPVYNNHQKNYKPIIVSLFGMKSIEEIQSEIFLCLFPYLKNSKIRLGASVGKAVSKGILHLKGLGEYSKYLEEIEGDKKILINFEELLICFDDLERLSNSLNIEDFIGYVNSLVENENVKVIIIANEDKIKDKNFAVIKEKVVGNTIEYLPDFENSFDNIIIAKYLGSPTYLQFLKDNKKWILQNFLKTSTNLRVLIFTLNYFQRIFSEVLNNLFTENTLIDKQSEILINLLKFTIAISIEYKESKISFKNREELDIKPKVDLSQLLLKERNIKSNSNEKEKEKSFRQKFMTKYYSENNYRFYTSLYNYITGGEVLKYEILIDELKEFYNIKGNKISPQDEILDNLDYQKCTSLRDNEYLDATKKMVEYASKGQYDLNLCWTIFHFALRFNNPLNYNVDKLEKLIIGGLKKGKKNFKHQGFLDRHLGDAPVGEFKNYFLNIRRAALEINQEILTKIKVNEAKELEKLCYSDFDVFFNKIVDGQQSLRHDPLFSNFNPKSFYNFFIRSTPRIRWEIVKLFAERYTEHPFPTLKPESKFLKQLSDYLEIKNKLLEGKNVMGFVCSELCNQIKHSIKRLDTTNN